MAGEDPFDDEDFEVAADEEEALSGAVDELKDVFHSLEDVLEEFTEISLDYADWRIVILLKAGIKCLRDSPAACIMAVKGHKIRKD